TGTGDRSSDPGRLRLGDRLELRHLDAGDETARLALLEPARAELERGRRAGRDGEPEGLLVGALLEPRRDEAGKQDVARADRRDRIDPRCQHPIPARLALGAEQRPATGLTRDQDVARADFRDRL